jgi:hypothetical protein
MFPSAITAMPEQGVSVFPALGAGDTATGTVPSGFAENLRLRMDTPPAGLSAASLPISTDNAVALLDAGGSLDPQMTGEPEALGLDMPDVILDLASLDTQAILDGPSHLIAEDESVAIDATLLPDETGEATVPLMPEQALFTDDTIAAPAEQAESIATPDETPEQTAPRSDAVTAPVQRPDLFGPQTASATMNSETAETPQDLAIDDAPANKAQQVAQLLATDQGAADSTPDKKPFAQTALPEAGIDQRLATTGQTPATTVPAQPLGENPSAQSAPASGTTTAAGSTGPMPQLQMTRPDWPVTAVAATVAGLSADGGTMVMELSPEALGPLRITLTLEGDTATVRFQTETPEAARLLNEAERQLSTELNRHGLTLGKHDAATGGQSQEQGRHSSQSAGKRHAADEPDIQNNTRLPIAGGVINLIA